MISAFIGSPGSGKSTAAAWVANKSVKHPNRPIRVCGHTVSAGHPLTITNFEFPGAYKLSWDLLGATDLRDALIIIDEIMLLADSRNFKQYSENTKFFMSQHRKMSCSILWMSQAYNDVDLKIRNLTMQYFLLEPYIFDFYRLTSIDHFVRVADYQIQSGYEYGKSQFFYGRPIYKLFDSFQTINRKTDNLNPYPLIEW